MSPARVAVVGGGISGLSCAFYLRRLGLEVDVFESSDRLGGKVLTSQLGGRPFDMGADAMLARTGWAVDLCNDLGIGDSLVSPKARRALVHARGRLRHLPMSSVLGLPSSTVELLRSGILSPAASLRFAMGLRRTLRLSGEDVSVGSVAARLLGESYRREVVEPLLGGIYAGDVDEMSLAAALPQWEAALRSSGRLPRPAPSSGEAVFVSFEEGLGKLIERLAQELPGIRLGAEVLSLRATAAGVEVVAERGEELFDACVVCAPAAAASRLVREASALASDSLAKIKYSSVAVVGMVCSKLQLPDASGFLVPPDRGTLLTACTFSDRKWAHLSDPGRTLLRCSAGRAGDERAMDMTDDQLVDRLVDDLRRIAEIDVDPLEARVQRWFSGLPGYRPGHLEMIDGVRSDLRRSRIFLTGAAAKGVGISACIQQARLTADEVIHQLGMTVDVR